MAKFKAYAYSGTQGKYRLDLDHTRRTFLFLLNNASPVTHETERGQTMTLRMNDQFWTLGFYNGSLFKRKGKKKENSFLHWLDLNRPLSMGECVQSILVSKDAGSFDSEIKDICRRNEDETTLLGNSVLSFSWKFSVSSGFDSSLQNFLSSENEKHGNPLRAIHSRTSA